MTKLLASLVLTLAISPLCFTQQDSYAYGEPSDLKGLKKVYVDTGPDTQSRNAILKDLEKSKLGFEMMEDIEDADILLGFGAGKVMDRVTGTVRDGYVVLREGSSRTGVGVVIVHARDKDRLVHSFSSTQEGGRPVFVSAFQRRPVTNFVREFIKLYKQANGLK